MSDPRIRVNDQIAGALRVRKQDSDMPVDLPLMERAFVWFHAGKHSDARELDGLPKIKRQGEGAVVGVGSEKFPVARRVSEGHAVSLFQRDSVPDAEVV